MNILHATLAGGTKVPIGNTQCANPCCSGKLKIDQKVSMCCGKIFCAMCSLSKSCIQCGADLNRRTKQVSLISIGAHGSVNEKDRDCFDDFFNTMMMIVLIIVAGNFFSK